VSVAVGVRLAGRGCAVALIAPGACAMMVPLAPGTSMQLIALSSVNRDGAGNPAWREPVGPAPSQVDLV